MKKAYLLRIERNDKEQICKYGRHEQKCSVWVDNCKRNPKIQTISKFGRCHLSGCIECPLYKMRVNAGNRIKEYMITAKDYRNMSGSAHWLIKNQTTKVVFFTLTFPPTIKKHKLTKSFYLDEIANKLFSKFLDNFKKTYHCTGYIAVKEKGDKNNRTHFHVLACFPFINFSVLNSAWCEAISNYCWYSPNALQTDSKYSAVIKNPNRAIRYICKYFSKARRDNGRGYTRIMFISRNLINKKAPIYDITPAEILKGYKGIFIQSLKYVTILRVTEEKSFNSLCDEFIYELFRQQMKGAEMKYREKDEEIILKTLNRKHKKRHNKHKKAKEPVKLPAKSRPRIYKLLMF